MPKHVVQLTSFIRDQLVFDFLTLYLSCYTQNGDASTQRR